MARSRNIKPGFFTNDALAELPALTRLLFIGLWTIVDRDGRVEDRPKKIKAETMPYDDMDCDKALESLEKAGFIQRYVVGEVKAIQVLNWSKHQNPHVKEQASTMPAPDRHHASTGQELGNTSECTEVTGLIPDSGFPLTDSLNTDSLKEETTPRKRSAQPVFDLPDWINKTHWDVWHSTGKRKKATVEQKELAIEKLNKWREAGQDYAGALENAAVGGNQGLYLPNAQKAGKQAESFRESDQKATARRFAAFTGQQPTGNVIDITPKNMEIDYEPATKSY